MKKRETFFKEFLEQIDAVGPEELARFSDAYYSSIFIPPFISFCVSSSGR
ncbi:MAG: hypothetical protein ACMUJM_25390 [bacterium]